MNTDNVNVKSYYLAYEPQPDGRMDLTPITPARWHEILAGNRGKHGKDRRYFIQELHSGCSGSYWFVCEVSWEEYREWDALRHLNKRRDDKHRRDFSLDAFCFQDDNGSLISAKETIVDPNADTERDGDWLVKLAQLRHDLAEWKEWGPEMLDYYQAEVGRDCTGSLAKEHDCSDECIRYRKRLFRAKVRELCVKYGIGNFT